ncbi:hypothetical protein LJR219_001000 [Phenylobacterium sp. LjRoot219]|uniref:hypothetical protein n=1 Tax=Phenylobacterium sp. LjRoot219 TaxID=3342283 RepID=UPI003ECF257E
MLRSLLAGAVLALCAGAAYAQPESAAQTKVCVDVNGALRPADCHGQASRLETREDICLCSGGGRQVAASICPPGVAPPGESLAVAKARNQLLRSQDTLVGATFEGRPLCVPPTQR